MLPQQLAPPQLPILQGAEQLIRQDLSSRPKPEPGLTSSFEALQNVYLQYPQVKIAWIILKFDTISFQFNKSLLSAEG